MSLRKLLHALGVLLVAAATPAAYAQFSNSASANPTQWQFYGGVNLPTGSNSHLLETGWNFGGGVSFRQPGAPFGLRLDLSYANNNVSAHGVYQASGAAQMNIDDGWVDTWALTASGELRHPFNSHTYGYATLGICMYYTRMELAEVGFGFVCNPWWNECYLATGHRVVGSDSSTKFGWNAGVGLGFALGNGASWFVEARYTWIDTANERLQFVPIVVGLRF